MSYENDKIQRIMVQPINLIFRFLQNQARVHIWINELRNKRFEGVIAGFDEYMNLVLSDTEEMNVRLKTSRKLGTILLRGDNVTLIRNAPKKKEG